MHGDSSENLGKPTSLLENAEVLEMGKVIAAVAWTAGGLWIGWTIGRMWFQAACQEDESRQEPESGWW